jgi:hypothetical protein
MTKFQNLQMKLAGSPIGRMTLHLLCFCQDGKLRWHARGCARELAKRPDCSAFAEGLADMHHTVCLKKAMNTAT